MEITKKIPTKKVKAVCKIGQGYNDERKVRIGHEGRKMPRVWCKNYMDTNQFRKEYAL